MAELINSHRRFYLFYIFFAASDFPTGMQVFQPRGKKKQFSLNYKVLNLIVSSLVSRLPFLIGPLSERFQLHQISKSILNFVFILPAWILLISSRLVNNPEKRIGKNCIKTNLSEKANDSKRNKRIHWMFKQECALTSTGQSLAKKRHFIKKVKIYSKKTAKNLASPIVPGLASEPSSVSARGRTLSRYCWLKFCLRMAEC